MLASYIPIDRYYIHTANSFLLGVDIEAHFSLSLVPVHTIYDLSLGIRFILGRCLNAGA